jgi:hypothetical protein
MDFALKVYVALWATACAAALGLYLSRRDKYVISQRKYWHFLTEPWKVAAFVAGASLITLVAPYTGDPTWDYFDGFFMSVFCYTTAPWVLGILYQARHRRARVDELYIAVCTWLFSASWSYDIYLLWRDGYYPITWFANLFASSLIYLCAGLFWNLEHLPGRGVIFSFMREGWPSRPLQSSVLRIAAWGAVFAIPAIAAVLIFIL